MPKENKKILFFQPSLRAGGAERFSLDLAKELRNSGYDVSFLLFADGGYFLEEAQEAGFVVTVLKKHFKLDLVNFVRAKREIRRLRPDTIVCRLGANLYGPYLKGRAKLLSIEDNVNQNESKLMSYLKSLAYKKTDIIIAVSETVKKDVIKRYGVLSDKISVIYNGLDFSRFPNYFKENNKVPVIASMGRLVPQKNYSLLISALAEIGLDFKCLIAGEGRKRAILETMIKNLGLESKVFLVGLKKDVGRFMSDADIFVLPSLWEGLGIVVLEAGYYGLPVLVSDIESVGEIISDRNGFVFKTNSKQDLVEKLTYLLENLYSQEILEKGAILKEDVSNKFSIKEMTGHYIKILETL